jgi:hypothetical protein
MSEAEDLTQFLRAQVDDDERSARIWGSACVHIQACDETGDFTDRFGEARILAEVKAKRAVLDLHESTVDYQGRAVCRHCTDLCHSRSGLGCADPDAPFPCETVSLLAQPYADREGWNEAWRVST